MYAYILHCENYFDKYNISIDGFCNSVFLCISSRISDRYGFSLRCALEADIIL